jgi:hypothetical protein
MDIKAFERLSYEKILSSVAKRYQIQVEEGLIDSIISELLAYFHLVLRS